MGLQSLRKRLNETGIYKVPTEKIISIKFKFAPPYPCILMDEIETSFLKTQQLQQFIWLRYVDDTHFILTHGEEQLNLFPKDLNEFHPNLKFTYETS